MKALLHITLAKMRKDFRKSLFQSFAAFVSMFAISFFVCFVISLEAFRSANPTFGIEAIGGSQHRQVLPTLLRLSLTLKQAILSTGPVAT